MSSRPDWTGRHALLWLVPLAVLVKALFVFALADVFFYGEEIEKGTAAKAMLDGLAVPHHELAYHYYEGGGFAVSHLKALAFLVVGQNLLAHKLVALAFVVAILVVGWGFVRSLFGERAALWFGLLYVFSPASFQKLSMVSLGIHFEACLFLLAILWLTARLVFREKSGWPTCLALGLVTGFGVYFSYQTVIAAGYAALLLAAVRPRLVFGLARDGGPGGLAGLGGFLVGALPLWIMLALVGGQVFDVHGTGLAATGSAVPRAEKLAAFWRSLYAGRGPLELAGAVVWPLATIVAVFAGLATRGPGAGSFRRRQGFVLGYLACFLVAYLASAFVQGEVYHFFLLLRLAPVWIVALVLIAAAIGRLSATAAPSPSWLGRGLGFVPLAVGVVSALAIVAAGAPTKPVRNAGLLARTKGYVYAPYFAKLLPHIAGDEEAKLRILLGFDEPAADWLRAEIAAELFREPAPELQTTYVRARVLVERVDRGHVAAYELGLGPLLLVGNDWNLTAALRRASSGPPDIRARLLEALGRVGTGGHAEPGALRAELELSATCQDPAAFQRGTGHRLYVRYRTDPEAAESFLQVLEPTIAPAVRAGYTAAQSDYRLP